MCFSRISFEDMYVANINLLDESFRTIIRTTAATVVVVVTVCSTVVQSNNYYTVSIRSSYNRESKVCGSIGMQRSVQKQQLLLLLYCCCSSYTIPGII